MLSKNCKLAFKSKITTFPFDLDMSCGPGSEGNVEKIEKNSNILEESCYY